jgi:hypothetical protein
LPVLPLIDLLIMLGWTSLMGACLLKAIYITTAYRPRVFGMDPSDFVLVAGVCLLFALTLAARTWVKYHEPRLFAGRRNGRREPLDVIEGEREEAGPTPMHGARHAAGDRP